MRLNSISTPKIKHDITNFIVEMLAINNFGILPEYCWRKGKEHHEFWKENIKFIRRILKFSQITPAQLAFHIMCHDIVDISNSQAIAKSIFVAKKMNENHNIVGIVNIFRQKYDKLLLDRNQKFVTEPQAGKARRDLFDLLG